MAGHGSLAALSDESTVRDDKKPRKLQVITDGNQENKELQQQQLSLDSRSPEIPKFQSALAYTNVRDFAYPEFHPLHYGVRPQSIQSQDQDEDEDRYYDDDNGPPWQEDADLASPVIKSHEVGDRISREYEFSVSSIDEIHGRAVALFDFTPENDNEAPLKEGQIIWISYRHGQGWLVAEDPITGEKGLVPEEYVEMIPPRQSTEEQKQDNVQQEEVAPEQGTVSLDTAIRNPVIYHSPEEGWVDENEETPRISKLNLNE